MDEDDGFLQQGYVMSPGFNGASKTKTQLPAKFHCYFKHFNHLSITFHYPRAFCQGKRLFSPRNKLAWVILTPCVFHRKQENSAKSLIKNRNLTQVSISANDILAEIQLPYSESSINFPSPMEEIRKTKNSP